MLYSGEELTLITYKSYCPTITGFEIWPQYLQGLSNCHCLYSYCVCGNGKAMFQFFWYLIQGFFENGIEVSLLGPTKYCFVQHPTFFSMTWNFRATV